jgi:hypothetical protein
MKFCSLYFFHVVQGIYNFNNLSVAIISLKGLVLVSFLLFYYCYVITKNTLRETPFNFPLFKGTWKMEAEHLSGALRLQTNNGRKKWPRILLTPVRPCLRRHLTRTVEIFSGT